MTYDVYETEIDMFGDPMGARLILEDLPYAEAMSRIEEYPNRFLVPHNLKNRKE